MKFDVLYYLMNEKISLVEIKRADLAANSPKEDVYQWFMFKDDDSKEKLEFISQKEEDVAGKKINVRIFKDAELRFDKLFGKFVLEDELFILKNCSSFEIPQSISEKINS